MIYSLGQPHLGPSRTAWGHHHCTQRLVVALCWCAQDTERGRSSQAEPKQETSPSSCSCGVRGSQWEMNTYARSEHAVIVLGVILLVIGFLTGISILWTIGIILAVIGVVLWILGSLGHAVAGRKHYW